MKSLVSSPIPRTAGHSQPARLPVPAAALCAGVGIVVAVLQPCTGLAQPTAITYQGVLTDGGRPAQGLYDFSAQVYNAAASGEPGDTLVSPTVIRSAVAVTNGLFVLDLDFGAAPFNGQTRWLQLAVRTNGGANFISLIPRQAVSSAPQAIVAGALSGSLSAAQLTGTIPAASLPTGGNWALNTTLTIDGGTLAIDPANNRVGIGISNPSYSLHMVSGQSVARLDSSGSAFGSVLELRNTGASPTYLGAINFNNAAGTFPGQIGYLDTHTLVFRTGGAERMWLDNNGNLGVTAPSGTGVRGEAVATTGTTWGVRGLVHSPSGNGVAGENDSASGIGVYGLQGGGTGSRTPAGVYGESLQPAGNGVVGVAHNGASAYGVWGRSSSGFAGAFDGAVRIAGDSSHNKPFLQVYETQANDYARIQLQVANHPLWHISVGGTDNSLVFYNSTNSIVTSVSESGVLTTRVLTITGGADIAEPFKMSQPGLPKGAVVVIDQEQPGRLKLSAEPYDRRVAGIISGAGGVNPGLSLQQSGVVEGDQQVALTGRVYVQADTSNGRIKPGDLLTTSAKPGHAMKVTDYPRAQGAILGKAMTSLDDADGLVLVLITLQ